ncbi:hypothetical protein OnM2_103042 [Erysiphe neolycopersici]|uniref:Uncharacterized protein n=1 Tax=Erysiphe neolycopersici TaxID=212602 RepID=A0A420H897_9PEZI|nr:hypothetical protein OnM2_103042 [Erysiphe neolycopersici]
MCPETLLANNLEINSQKQTSSLIDLSNPREVQVHCKNPQTLIDRIKKTTTSEDSLNAVIEALCYGL